MASSAIAPHERNASLLLTKHIDGDLGKFKTENKVDAIESILQCKPPPGYERAYERWKVEIHSMPGITLAARFSVDDRVITGLGAPNVLEFSVAMNRLWGMPIIVGSGLKGLVSHFTRRPASLNAVVGSSPTTDQLVDLFGSEQIAGAVDWLDAWYIPGAGLPYAPDGNTPHYGAWYEDPTRPPLGHQDPVPSSFISVRGSFLVAVRAPTEEWAIAALNQLRWAAQAWGVGAKTNAGYGFMRFDKYESPWIVDWLDQEKARTEADRVDREAREKLAATFDELNDESIQPKDYAKRWVETWNAQKNEAIKTELGRLILQRITKRQRVFHDLTGRSIRKYSRAQGAPKTYMRPFLEWVDTLDGEDLKP